MTDEQKLILQDMISRRMEETGEDRVTAAMCIQHYLTTRYLQQQLDEVPNY